MKQSPFEIIFHSSGLVSVQTPLLFFVLTDDEYSKAVCRGKAVLKAWENAAQRRICKEIN